MGFLLVKLGEGINERYFLVCCFNAKLLWTFYVLFS